MKKLLLAGCAAMLSIHAYAQTPITLTKDNVPFDKRDVKVNVIKLGNFTSPTVGDSQMWDYSKLESLGGETYYFYNSANSQFSSTAINETFLEPVTEDRAITLFNYMDKSTNGIIVPGFSAEYQAYGIGDLTMNPDDTFYVPAQTQVYKNPIYNIKFPATENSMWTNVTRRAIDFQLTLTNFGFNKTPGQKVTNFTRRDNVVGWGKMRLPVDTSKSMWYDVLMINTGGNREDSIYLNGEPAPALMLGAFGMQQGQITENYGTYFYRASDFFPLMYINYGTDFTRANPVSAFYTTDNVVVTGLKKNANVFTPNVYPNPASGNNIVVSFNKNSNADWKLNLVNTLGQTVQSQTINAAAGNLSTSVNIENVTASGIYFIQLVDGNGALQGSAKVIIRK